MWQETEITRIALGTDRLPGCMDSYLHQIREGGHELLQAVGGTALESFSLGVLGNIAEKLGIAAHMEPELPSSGRGSWALKAPALPQFWLRSFRAHARIRLHVIFRARCCSF